MRWQGGHERLDTPLQNLNKSGLRNLALVLASLAPGKSLRDALGELLRTHEVNDKLI